MPMPALTLNFQRPDANLQLPCPLETILHTLEANFDPLEPNVCPLHSVGHRPLRGRCPKSQLRFY